MIERRNHEGYADPTAHAALTKVFRQNLFTYICSPYRDNPRVNVMRAGCPDTASRCRQTDFVGLPWRERHTPSGRRSLRGF